jgi:hypothetical protein
MYNLPNPILYAKKTPENEKDQSNVYKINKTLNLHIPVQQQQVSGCGTEYSENMASKGQWAN